MATVAVAAMVTALGVWRIYSSSSSINSSPTTNSGGSSRGGSGGKGIHRGNSSRQGSSGSKEGSSNNREGSNKEGDSRDGSRLAVEKAIAKKAAIEPVFSVSVRNTLVTPITLRHLKG